MDSLGEVEENQWHAYRQLPRPVDQSRVSRNSFTFLFHGIRVPFEGKVGRSLFRVLQDSSKQKRSLRSLRDESIFVGLPGHFLSNVKETQFLRRIKQIYVNVRQSREVQFFTRLFRCVSAVALGKLRFVCSYLTTTFPQATPPPPVLTLIQYRSK